MKKKIMSAAQMAAGIAILVAIFLKMRNRGDLLEAIRGAAAHWPLLAGGVACFGLCILICTLRWNRLLAAQGLRLPYRRALALTFVGHFFNSFLPGATSGDLVKAYYTARETRHRRTEVVATVFIDRIVGILGLILLALTVMAVRFRFFMSHPATRVALLFNALLLAGAAAGLFVVFRRNLFERLHVFRRLERGTALGSIIGRAYEAFRICFRERGVAAGAVALSVVNHVVLVVSCWLLGLGLEIRLPFADYLSMFPVINAVAAIPVTPGGLGTRDAATTYLLGVLGVPASRAVALSLLLYATMLAWSLVGGLAYLHYVYQLGRVKPADLTNPAG